MLASRLWRIAAVALVLTVSGRRCRAQNVEIEHGQNPIDNETWIAFVIRSEQPVSGVQPVLRIQCSQKGGKRRQEIFLRSGPLQRLNDGFATMRVKVDQGKPWQQMWQQLPDASTFKLGALANLVHKPGDVLREFLSAHIVYVEFYPFGGTGAITAVFDVSHLRQAYDGFDECRSK